MRPRQISVCKSKRRIPAKLYSAAAETLPLESAHPQGQAGENLVQLVLRGQQQGGRIGLSHWIRSRGDRRIIIARAVEHSPLMPDANSQTNCLTTQNVRIIARITFINVATASGTTSVMRSGQQQMADWQVDHWLFQLFKSTGMAAAAALAIARYQLHARQALVVVTLRAQLPPISKLKSANTCERTFLTSRWVFVHTLHGPTSPLATRIYPGCSWTVLH